ncbi:YcdB/YcdC domain-containing protein [Caldanaerobius polysaccharolyticus]|uniref:YcdB/YcdC domain-containing protein n=1 Tax=Caldanaerobius polysaccharolyticus TaxID=44256 RepID=UPI00047B1182|nr:YcdB/YcdC domain-containing protein [Caldanaerobius polysaccharolyticus]
MKKKFALLMVLTTLLTILVPVQGFAQYDKELENAITKAKSLFDISESYDRFSSNLSIYNGVKTYTLNWSDSKNKLGSILVTIDSNGNILNYNRYKPYDENSQNRLPKISKNDAVDAAKKFIAKVAPDISKDLLYTDSYIPIPVGISDYQLYFVRTVNGIPFPANYVNISVDKNTGEVKSYYRNWNFDLVFPDKAGIISIDEAQKIYREKISLNLVYKFKYEGDTPKIYLAYTTLADNKAIDAKSGQIVSASYYYGIMDEMGRKTINAMDSGSTPELTPVEKDAIKEMSEIISEQKAEELARANKFVKLSSDYKLNSINLYKNWTDQTQYIWELNFSKTVNDEPYYVNVGIDAKTGEITYFNRYTPDNEKAPVKYNQEQALQIAKDFLKDIQPEKSQQVEYIETNPPVVKPLSEDQKPRQYYFNFTRKANGAYFIGNGFSVTVDASDGEIISYSCSWYNGQLPSVDNVITLDKAYEVLFSKIGLQLEYITLSQDQKTQAILVYATTPGKAVNIDANTGALLGYNGDAIAETKTTEYSDIKGSYAEKAIKVLAEYGIALPGDKFMPDATIKQKEFLYLLARSLNPYIDYNLNDQKSLDSMYNYLVNRGIIKDEEISPESDVQRQDAAKYIIRALGFNKVADIKGIFSLPFKDADKVKPDLRGYMAIAYGLNIMRGSNGYIYPADNLTRSQGIMVIYNYLNID